MARDLPSAMLEPQIKRIGELRGTPRRPTLLFLDRAQLEATLALAEPVDRLPDDLPRLPLAPMLGGALMLPMVRLCGEDCWAVPSGMSVPTVRGSITYEWVCRCAGAAPRKVSPSSACALRVTKEPYRAECANENCRGDCQLVRQSIGEGPLTAQWLSCRCWSG
jgi:hypothetical protein